MLTSILVLSLTLPMSYVQVIWYFTVSYHISAQSRYYRTDKASIFLLKSRGAPHDVNLDTANSPIKIGIRGVRHPLDTWAWLSWLTLKSFWISDSCQWMVLPMYRCPPVSSAAVQPACGSQIIIRELFYQRFRLNRSRFLRNVALRHLWILCLYLGPLGKSLMSSLTKLIISLKGEYLWSATSCHPNICSCSAGMLCRTVLRDIFCDKVTS